MKLIFEGTPDEIKMLLGIEVHALKVNSTPPKKDPYLDEKYWEGTYSHLAPSAEVFAKPPEVHPENLRRPVDSVSKAPENSAPAEDRKACMICPSTDGVKRYYPKSEGLILNPGDGFVEYCRKHAIQNGYIREEEIAGDSVSRLPDPAAHVPDRIKKSDLMIPPFKYDKKLEKWYKKVAFVEFGDGRIVLKYLSQHVYTHRRIIDRLPKPLPPGYLKHSGISPNVNTAFRAYCDYLSVKPAASPDLATDRKLSVDSVSKAPENSAPAEDRKEDPDRVFKPLLRGAINTRCNYDGSKLEAVM